jgi:hypothetical protein
MLNLSSHLGDDATDENIESAASSRVENRLEILRI